MKLLDNHSRFNNMVVSQGLRVAKGNAASSYILYKRIEKALKKHVEELLKDADGSQEKQNSKVVEYVEITLHKSLVKLNSINSLSTLKQYSRYNDMNALMRELTGRNVKVKKESILNL